jgi:hypothetical protein
MEIAIPPVILPDEQHVTLTPIYGLFPQSSWKRF